MDDNHIDNLLERYLHLLHEYTSLREELTTLQNGMYQNIARANFAAERGMRFGQDNYDDRMQASRRLYISYGTADHGREQTQDPGEIRNIKESDAVTPTFTVINPADAVGVAKLTAAISMINVNPTSSRSSPPPEAENQAGLEEQQATKTADADAEKAGRESTVLPQSQTERDANTIKSEERPETDSPTSTKGGETKRRKSDDPVRWFGLLTPLALRQAQAQSIRAIEHVVPRLASVSAEMADVEIEVRRARKRRAKAAAASTRLPQTHAQTRELKTATESGAPSDVCV
ncbi:hypothetical protein F4808DRAFT_82444 [Astrocystis sublimbata]|nr:hypothetical protein F4808DRAFT_82444 [Astrocystis sublimbata]